MRIISFATMWGKLKALRFTTFRFPRKDKDWQVGEVVQVWYKTRSPDREYIGQATIVGKERRNLYLGGSSDCITDEEAKADGFFSKGEMLSWLYSKHGRERFLAEGYINKLTLEYAGGRVE